MSNITLLEKANQVLEEKNTKILPENLKAGITAFGVEGALSVDTKHFNTEEEMQSDSNASYGDLAVLYNNKPYIINADTEFKFVVFPETVVLDSAVGQHDWISIGFAPVDKEKYKTGYSMTEISGRSATIEIAISEAGADSYETIGRAYARYTSTDGIIYTRTNISGTILVDEDTVELPCEVKYSGTWKDIASKFVKAKNNYLGGVFTYTENGITTDNIYAYDFNEVVIENNKLKDVKLSDKTFNLAEIKEVLNHTPFVTSLNPRYNGAAIAYADGIYYIHPRASASYVTSGGLTILYDVDNSKTYISIVHINAAGEGTEYLWIYNPTTGETTSQTFSQWAGEALLPGQYGSPYKKVVEVSNLSKVFSVGYNGSELIRIPNYSYTGETKSSFYKELAYYQYDAYVPATSHFSATADYVYKEKTFLGKNGAEEGLLGAAPSNKFDDINAQLFVDMQKAYDAMEPLKFYGREDLDKNTKILPVKSDGTPLIDITNLNYAVGAFQSLPNLEYAMGFTADFNNYNYNSIFNNRADSLFSYCPKLKYVCDMDLSGVTLITNMFDGDESLVKAPMLTLTNVQRIGYMFNDCSSLVYVPEGLNFATVTYAAGTFRDCSSLEEVPAFNFSVLEDTNDMFNGCTKLITIPAFSFNTVTTATNMFLNCTALSDNTLNSILGMCATNNLLVTKTLAYLGLTSEQATKCASLSNYQTFIDAGWTTGY